jgi:hypothetical protein
LKLDYASRQTIWCVTELAGVEDVGRRCCRNKRGQIKNIEDVEEVSANRQFRSLTQERLLAARLPGLLLITYCSNCGVSSACDRSSARFDSRTPSYEKKKNSRSFTIGPPMLPA